MREGNNPFLSSLSSAHSCSLVVSFLVRRRFFPTAQQLQQLSLLCACCPTQLYIETKPADHGRESTKVRVSSPSRRSLPSTFGLFGHTLNTRLVSRARTSQNKEAHKWRPLRYKFCCQNLRRTQRSSFGREPLLSDKV